MSKYGYKLLAAASGPKGRALRIGQIAEFGRTPSISFDIHQAGDAACSALPKSSECYCQHGRLASRYGGEEFAVVLPGVTEDGAVMLADAIRLLVQLR